MEEQSNENMNKWMDDAKAPKPLPQGRGVVGAIQPPVPIDTRFGPRKACQVVINGKDGSTINVKLFLPEQFPMMHPKSNLARILAHYGCQGLKELIGKEVEVEDAGDMLWKIKFE